MSRPEAAVEPSMEEILASIRRIIAEEPIGAARPKPAERAEPAIPQRAPAPTPQASMLNQKPASASAPLPTGMFATPAEPQPAVGAAEKQTEPADPAHAEPVTAGTPAPSMKRNAPEADPFASAFATVAPRPEPPRMDTPSAPMARAEPAAPTRQGVPARDEPRPMQSSAAAADSQDLMFGRLANALRNAGASKSEEPRAELPSAAVAAPAVPTGKAAPLPVALDDLADLLAGDEVAPVAAAPEPVAEPDPPAATSRPVNFGDIVPGRDEPVSSATAAAAPAPVLSASSPTSAEKAHRSAQAEAFGKMLRARLGIAPKTGDAAVASEKSDDLDAQHPADAAIRSDDVGPAAMVSASKVPADADGDRASDSGASSAIALPVDIETPSAHAELDDLEDSEAAKSALGALVAGLAASSSSELATEPAREVGATTAEVVSAASDALAVTEADAAADVPAEDAAAEAFAPVDDAVTPADEPDMVHVAAEPSDEPRGATFAPAIVAAVAEPQSPPAPQVSAANIPIAPAARFASQPATPPAESAPAMAAATAIAAAAGQPSAPAAGLPLVGASGLPASIAGGAVGVRTVEDIVADLLRPMLREWLAENMPRMVEKALRIELAEGLKTINQPPARPKGD